MKAAVFGANGYLGRHLVHYLLNEKNTKPVCFDVQDSFNGDDDVNYYKTDITDKSQWKFGEEDLDVIYFFSGLTGTDVSIDKYEDYVKVNEVGLLHLLNHIKQMKKKPKIVFPSTRLVYKGVEGKPLKEDDEKEFKTIYASSKYNGEVYLKMFRNLYDIDYSVFRICVPYGNMLGGKLSYGTISFFLDRALNKEPISLFGDGHLKRTFTHVIDVCRQMVDVSSLPQSNGECYNTDGETFSLKQIASIIAEKHGVEVVFKEWPAKAWQLESGDTIFDAEKIRSLYPQTLNYSLQEWINS